MFFNKNSSGQNVDENVDENVDVNVDENVDENVGVNVDVNVNVDEDTAKVVGGVKADVGSPSTGYEVAK